MSSTTAPPAAQPQEAPEINQIAALPYRSSGPGADAPLEILLVTSRGTGRWVLPKGNLSKRLSPAAAAAREAHEEAGLEGAIASAPMGAYRYHKLLDGGTALLVEVDVYPLAVTGELDDWPERAERERRWFTLGDAAAAVDEPDLRVLIQSFRSTAIPE